MSGFPRSEHTPIFTKPKRKRSRTLAAFVRRHRGHINATVRAQNGGESIGRLNDAEREDFVMNIESLYLEAGRWGVDISLD